MPWSVTWLLALTLALTSCATGGGGIDPCGPWRPVLVSAADELTRPTAEAILAHNETGRRLCGW